jgi:hypothetical protein
MDSDNSTTYTSRDFYLSAFLVASGCQLESIHRERQGLTYFTFPISNKLNQLVSLYFTADASVHPAKYGYALKMLKGVIRQPYSDENLCQTITKTIM